jgi:alpha-ketoglutaric semialdehyde dehydrogenase
MVTQLSAAAPAVISAEVGNWIDNAEHTAVGGRWFEKRDPATGVVLTRVARSSADDVDRAVRSARAAQPDWGRTPGVERGAVLYRLADVLHRNRAEMARVVATETGKSLPLALGETDAAVALGRFMAGEGQRLYGRTTTSGTVHRYAMTVRCPLGVAGLIVAANTPVANVAWKVFPALICGNAAVLKGAEDAPATAALFARFAHQAGLPAGVLNVVQGLGPEAGAALVAHADVAVLSFTGSTAVGRQIAAQAAARMTRISLELGGKNPLVICDDADLDHAVKWAVASAFSNAGQRCASGSRIIIFDNVYEPLRDMLIDATRRLKVGTGDADDLGPVINERQLKGMLAALERARSRGARVLIGGKKLDGPAHAAGYYLAPTLVEGVDPDDELSTTELFGPVASLYRARDFAHALELANRSPYGLTACIHTRSIHRAMDFAFRVETGVAVVNAGTYGSEPHMPFGGVRQSGNGTREPGTEALDVYSNLKDIYISVLPQQI